MFSFLKSHKLWLYVTGQHKVLELKEVKLLMPMFFAIKIGMTPTMKLSLGFATPLLLLFTLNLGDTTRDVQT